MPRKRPFKMLMVGDDESSNLTNVVAPREIKDQAKAAAITTVITLFPDICPDFLNTLWDDLVHGGNAEVFIAGVLERMDKDKEYPKKKKDTLKRKRDTDEEEELSNKFEYVGRASNAMGTSYALTVRNILQDEFLRTPLNHVDKVLTANRGLLFPAYRLLEEHERTVDEVHGIPYRRLKKARKTSCQYLPHLLANTIAASSCPNSRTAMEELIAARKVKAKADANRERERQKQLDEEQNIRHAEREGTMQECGCCFCEHPLNRMIHCNSESELHWFCRQCARQTAENEIGSGKYIVTCMSMDGCSAGFSQNQRAIFLESKSILALERNEQEAMLRMAGIENLASCPFCPYAAEYPPVEENREFRCEAPDCKKVSCRLCKLESHIPKSCEENAKENGISARRLVEEAMSAALIRKCNKCGTPFIKEEGCNKMMCTSGGCRNIQCYICSKSCGYDHFNDTTRGGREGNCPLFGDVGALHENDVNKAEREALDKVRAEHPELSEEDLKIKVSDDVLKDEAARKRAPRLRNDRYLLGVPPENLAGHYHDLLARNYYRRVALDRQLDPELRAELGIENMMIEDPPGYPVVPGIIPQRIKPQVVEPALGLARPRPLIPNDFLQFPQMLEIHRPDGRRQGGPMDQFAIPKRAAGLQGVEKPGDEQRPPQRNEMNHRVHEKFQDLAVFRQYMNQVPIHPPVPGVKHPINDEIYAGIDQAKNRRDDDWNNQIRRNLYGPRPDGIPAPPAAAANGKLGAVDENIAEIYRQIDRVRERVQAINQDRVDYMGRRELAEQREGPGSPEVNPEEIAQNRLAKIGDNKRDNRREQNREARVIEGLLNVRHHPRGEDEVRDLRSAALVNVGGDVDDDEEDDVNLFFGDLEPESPREQHDRLHDHKGLHRQLQNRDGQQQQQPWPAGNDHIRPPRGEPPQGELDANRHDTAEQKGQRRVPRGRASEPFLPLLLPENENRLDDEWKMYDFHDMEI